MIGNKYIKILFFIFFIFFSKIYFLNASSDGIDVNLHIGECNNNGICEAGSEDFFVCPADCTPIVIPPTIPSKNTTSGSILVSDNLFNNLSVEVSFNNVIIKWKSVIPTMSNIKWGASPDYKDGVIRNVNFLLDHKVEINNLKEGTVYYFTIEATNLLEKTSSLENQVFRTLSLLDTTAPSNPTNVIAISNDSGITISWTNPSEEDFDYVRIMRNIDRYYGSPYVGSVVYEGDGKYFRDSNVKDGTKYFYSLFSRDRAGNYSSGSLVDIVHNPKGKDTWGSILSPVEKVEPLKEDFIVTEGTSSYDFKIGNILYLSGDQLINIKTNHISKTKNDDMWVSIKNSDRSASWQYLFSRSRDKDGFINATIPIFEKSGYYTVTIYNYSNNVARIINQGAFQINKAHVKQGEDNSYFFNIFGFIVIILFIILLIIWFLFFVLLPRITKRNH